ncbi:transcription antitermination factor NusB [Dermatophilus congolensis]|uniref:transcription antitermination factor NusB n=1 Tax=Dermatophilus congolensis TaxID=1863 RepID=UPI001AAEA7D0|nr:transcription antitermination factor NusB [Dermatophilus congolensis]MBO3142416.1 transcription antitermination factor NusB [Dermatophilus congolensis]MBO3151407.1 transcription antitermination factor NusB [Dermatophilus congolensis]MBO3161591.1 transcription antitermination factor NusB [Dermatophilus congolensis]MBO3162692.1 transcription antitermination factor NusB [Dermatophilus congolensis]MBO3176245.1 transcription antitermination factor NusB [Dermatophilus congolensis]
MSQSSSESVRSGSGAGKRSRSGKPGQGSGTSARSKARREALDILFEAEQRGKRPLEMLAERVAHPARVNPPRAFAAQIVEGVADHWAAIDDAISTYSQGWALDRLPAVDRAALRVGTWEVLYHDETPDGVAVAEAVALVADLSTDSSPSFVNGLLSRIVEVKSTLV